MPYYADQPAAQTRLDLVLQPASDTLGDVTCAPSREEAAYGECEYTAAEAMDVAEALGIDWMMTPFTLEEFRLGMTIELEHERFTTLTSVVGEDPLVMGTLALTHLHIRPDYYTRLTRAHSPGDPVFPEHEHDEVGAD